MTDSQAQALLEENERLKSLVANLESQLAWLRKKVFGSMSEKHLPLDPAQLQLALFPDSTSEEEKVALEAEAARDKERIDRMVSCRKERPSRKPLDTSGLPVHEEHLYPVNINTDEYTELPPPP